MPRSTSKRRRQQQGREANPRTVPSKTSLFTHLFTQLYHKGWLSILLITLGVALLWLDLFFIPRAAPVPKLESSWHAGIVHFAAQKLQFGTDVIFTYGPLGHLVSAVYTGELFSARVGWEVVSQTIFAVVFCLTLMWLPIFWRPIFFLFLLLFVWAEGPSDALYTLVISCLAVFLFKHGSSSSALNVCAGILFAILSLIKFTYFLLIIVVLGLSVTLYCALRKTFQALLISSLFLFAFLICWGIANQEYRHLIAYLGTYLDISLGYKEAMKLPAISDAITTAGAAAASLGLIQCGLILFESRELSVLFTAFFIASETFLTWNRGFIRADDHVLSFFCLHPLVLATIWLVAKPRNTIRWAGYTINLMVLVICLFGISQQRPNQISGCLQTTMARLKNSWKIVTNLGTYSTQLQIGLTEAEKTYALPQIRTEVGDATIDVLGNIQALALLNHFRYTPRPIFQGYTAYTRKLIDLNTAFYKSAKAPEYVLFRVESIDNRYPTLDDAGVLKELLYTYKPLLEEHGCLLWKKMQPATPVQPGTAVTASLAFDSEHPIPANEIVWAELEIKPSLLGQLRNLFYKPPEVTIRVTDSSGQQSDNRLIPSMASSGFIISPKLQTASELLRLASGTPGLVNQSFSIHVADGAGKFFEPTITCRMSPLPPIPKSDLDGPARQLSDELEMQEAHQ